MKFTQKPFLAMLISGFIFSGCQKPQMTLAESKALKAPEVQTASESAAAAATSGSDDLESKLWDVTYSLVMNQSDPTPAATATPSPVPDANKPAANPAPVNPTIQATSISQTILSKIDDKNLTAQQKADLDEYFQKFYQIHSQILNSKKSTQDKLKILTSAELGKSSDPELQGLQTQLVDWRTQLHSLLIKDGITKEAPVEPPKSVTTTNAVESSLSLTNGARKTIAVAYQSCQLEALPPLTRQTPSAKGVTVLGKAKGGTGYERKITDLSLFTSTQYYYRDFSLGAQCSDVRKNPMIYNYGGKPNVETKNNISAIDLFAHGQDTPGVSPQLGIDCSGFVFTSIAAAGFRIKINTPMKPVLIYGVDSDMFLDPKANGLSCVDKVSMGASGTLKAGDVIAEPGHVILIGEVGADPLGVDRVTVETDCDKITTANFDFVVYQSSASKGGIGINKYLGKDYVIEDGYFRRGLTAYAQQSCHAKFTKKNLIITSRDITIDRFSDLPGCRQTPTPLVGESCVSSCF